MAVHNPGDEYSLKEILNNIEKLLETKTLFISDQRGLDTWLDYLKTRINRKLGRSKAG